MGAVWWYIWGMRKGYLPVYFGPSSKRWERNGWNEAEAQILRTWEGQGGKPEMRIPSERNFLRGANQARRVTLQWVWFEAEKRVRGLVRYGTDTEGPPRAVHGGCTATVVDACMGFVAWASTKKWIVTRNLDVNYRKFVPIGSTVQVDAWLDRIDGRKVFVKFEVWSFDRHVLHNEGSALFIDVRGKRTLDMAGGATEAPSIAAGSIESTSGSELEVPTNDQTVVAVGDPNGTVGARVGVETSVAAP